MYVISSIPHVVLEETMFFYCEGKMRSELILNYVDTKRRWLTDTHHCRCLTAGWWWSSRSSPPWSSACSWCWPTFSTSGAMCSSKTLQWVNNITLNKRCDVKDKKTKDLLSKSYNKDNLPINSKKLNNSFLI